MKSLMDIVLVVVALIALGFAIYEFYYYINSPGAEGHTGYLWKAIGGFVVLCVCALGLFLRNMGAEEEIHITQ